MVKLSSSSKYYTANIRFKDNAGKNHDIKMFHEIILKVIDEEKIEVHDETSLMKELLSTPPLRVNLDKKNIVFSACKL